MNDDHIQRQVDQLVGGDLSKPEARALIATFEDSPERWKRCALAFLEAQSWQRAFSGLGQVHMPADSDAADVGVPPVAVRGRALRFVATVAVSVLIGAVGAAWWFQLNPPASNDPGSTARQQSPPKQVRDVPNEADQTNLLGVVRILSDGRPETAYQLVNHKDREIVLLTSELNQPSEYDVRLMERKGYRIEQHRKVVSVSLANGSQFQFPVDWRHFRYVGEPVF